MDYQAVMIYRHKRKTEAMSMARIVKKPEERKREIVQAARNLFQTEGYDRVTMQDVIHHVGIAKGTIYHYFKSKSDLLEAVIQAITHELLEQMQQVVDETKGSALQKMEELVKQGDGSSSQSAVLEQLHKPGNEAMHVQLLTTVLAQQAPLYAQLIQQGCDEGLFQTNYPLECAEFMLTGIQFLTDVGIHPWTKDERTRRAEAFPSLIEQLLKAHPGSFGFLTKALKSAQ